MAHVVLYGGDRLGVYFGDLGVWRADYAVEESVYFHRVFDAD